MDSTLIQESLELIRSLEGFRANAYLDGEGGTLTIGWGTTKGIKIGMTITHEEAESYLRRDVADAVRTIDRLVRVQLNANERCSLISFIYNVGSKAFEKSTLLKKLNRNDRLGAADEMLRWIRQKDKVSTGLLNRRRKEKELFLKPELKRR